MQDFVHQPYGNYGIFLIMGNAGFCPSAIAIPMPSTFPERICKSGLCRPESFRYLQHCTLYSRHMTTVKEKQSSKSRCGFLDASLCSLYLNRSLNPKPLNPYLNPKYPTFLRFHIRESYYEPLKRWVSTGPGKPLNPYLEGQGT